MAKGTVSQGEMIFMTVVAMLIPAVLLIGSLVYTAFYANGYTLFQKIVVVIIALIIVGVAECILWVVWAGRKGLMGWQRHK